MASTPSDPFAKPMLIGGLLLLVSAVFVLVSNLFSTIEKNSTVGAGDTSMYEAASTQNLTPIGEVVAVDKSVAPKARSGADIYGNVCAACHDTGVLASPKLERSAWSERISKGLDGLVTSAINGINQMPARGGDPSLTDDEMRSAVQYMLTQAGYQELGAESAAAGTAEKADNSETDHSGSDQAQADSTAEVAQTGPEQARAQQPEQKAEKATAPSHAGIDGEKVYNGICMACHNAGVAGAPKLEAAAWNERIKAGLDSLYNNSINGINAMPAKGGNPSLSDDEVKAAVDYMLEAANVSIE